MSIELGMRLARTHRLWRAALDKALKPLGMTQSRWLTLFILNRLGDGVSQKVLAERVGIEGPTLVRLLDSLQRQDLIERRQDEEDKRSKRIHLTPTAKPLLEKIEFIAEEVRQNILSGMSEAQQGELQTLLQHIETNAVRIMSD